MSTVHFRLFFLSLILSTSLIAQTGTTTSDKTIPAGMELIDLTPIEINANMLVPAGVKAIEETYSYYISGGDFIISVESAYDMTPDQLKSEIASNPDKKLISTMPRSVVYTEKMLGTEAAHFESYIEVDGKLFRLYDKRVKPLNVAQVTAMAESAETIGKL